jgi:hypothetical protein
VKAVIGCIVGAVGFGASLLAYVQTSKDTWRKIGDFVYPGIVIGALGALLLIAVVVLAVMHRQHNTAFDPEGQHQVDRILSTLRVCSWTTSPSPTSWRHGVTTPPGIR